MPFPPLRTFLSTMLLITAPLFAAQAKDTPDPGKNKPGWELIFDEEFNGTNADLDRNWEFQNDRSGHIMSSRWRENVTAGDGLCRLIYKHERRAGQEYTSGNMWTKQRFQYGYFECRYRYGKAPGLNNSFWIMPQDRNNKAGLFEIDINEGHFPDEINMTLHKWEGKHTGKSLAYTVGSPQKATQFVLPQPVVTNKLRLMAREFGAARVTEWRVFPYRHGGYPNLKPDGTVQEPAIPNLAQGARLTASSSINAVHLPPMANDGDLDTSWWSVEDSGLHTLTLDLGRKQEIGCLQLLTGRRTDGLWQNTLKDFYVDYWNGQEWVRLPGTRQRKVPVADLSREFHVYAAEWNEKEIVWYFDGRVLFRQPNNWAHRPAPVLLSGAVHRWAGPVSPAVDGKSMDVDYVRVYQRRDAATKAK